jgi:hypothetical protein
MKSFGSLPAWSRRAAPAIALGAFAVVCAASGVSAQSAPQAQTPPPQQTPAAAAQPQPAPESGLTAKSSPTVFFNAVKPDKTADFEAAMSKLKEALAKTDKEDLKKLADGWRVFKVAESAVPNPANPGNPVIYLWVIEPAAVGSAYDPGKVIYDAFPRAEADEIFNKLKDCYATLQRWTLEKIVEMKSGG